MLLDHLEELCGAGDSRYTGAKLAGAGSALCIATGVLAHEDGSFPLAEALDHQLIMVLQKLTLFSQRGVGRDRLAAQCGLCLAKEPGLAQGSPCNHHAIDVVA